MLRYVLRYELHVPNVACTCSSLPPSFIHQERALETGRVVPRETLEIALEQVPRSVKILAPMVTYFCELNNAPGAADIELVTPGETWESFERRWHQTCAWVPSRRKFLKASKQNDPKLAIGGRKVN